VLKDRLANDVRRNGTHSSETDDDRVLLAQILSSSDDDKETINLNSATIIFSCCAILFSL